MLVAITVHTVVFNVHHGDGYEHNRIAGHVTPFSSTTAFLMLFFRFLAYCKPAVGL